MNALKSAWRRLRRVLRLGPRLPSEDFFDARSRALGPDAYDHVDVDRQFRKP